ncbi:MAG: hypothetical protein RMJ33_06935 [Saprospiraceae bacterium]|nr:hypothetical protein [Saprospiraceae bacterium]MDW8229556.1 hypothetical protein [Saprospiraceae bacterium]
MRIALLSLCLLTHTLHAQGPLDGYLKGKGVLDVVPSFSFNSARQFWGAEGLRYDEGFRGNTLALFAEYGLTERLDAVATAAYVFTQTQSGLQDGSLHLKYRPVYRPMGKAGHLGLLLGAGASFPLARYNVVAAGALGQRAVALPLRLIAQWDTPLGLFFNLTGGYHWRIDRLAAADVEAIRRVRPAFQPTEPSSFYTALLRVGFPAARYYLDAWFEYQHTPGGSNYTPGVSDLPQAYGVSFAQVGGTAYYSENGRLGFIFSGAYMLGGRNTAQMLRLTAGMAFRWGG